jgi:hypothetical protein
LPELLLPATPLVHLRLSNITHFGYISAKAIVTCLRACPGSNHSYFPISP